MAFGRAQRRASRRSRPDHSIARTLAALIGTPPVALGVGVVLVRALPLGVPERTLLGYFPVFPIWAALCLWVFLARSGRRAWIGLFAVSALLGAAVVVSEPVRSERMASDGIVGAGLVREERMASGGAPIGSAP